MKYCYNCGNELVDEAVICPKCGVSVISTNIKDERNTGFLVLSFILPVAGLVLWLIWADTMPLRAKSCKTGFVISVIVWIVLVAIYLLIIIYAINGRGNSTDYTFTY